MSFSPEPSFSPATAVDKEGAKKTSPDELRFFYILEMLTR